MNNIKNRILLLSSLLVLSLPISSLASESIVIEKTFSTYNKNDTGRDNFENQYEKDGMTYELSDLKTEIVDTQDYEGDMYIYTTDFVSSENELTDPDATIEHEGTTYQLQSKKVITNQSQNKTKYAEKKISYEGIESADEVPSFAEFVEVDDFGKEYSKYLPLIDIKIEKENWDKTFEFPIQITNYDADSFMLNGTEIKKTEPLINYEMEFLEYLGLPMDYYKITSIEWSGSEYSSDGIICRNAIAKGEKVVRDITATYGGEMVIGEATQYAYECIYVNPDKPSSTIYTIKATGTYTEKVKEIVESESETEPEPLVPEVPSQNIFTRMIHWISENPIAALGIGTVSVIGIGILILFLLAKKKKKEEEKVEIIDFDKK